MVYYRAVGDIPAKRHTMFETRYGAPCFEEFIGEEGFSSTGSLLYHRSVPSNLVGARDWLPGDLGTTVNHPLGPRHFRLPELFANDTYRGNDLVRDRRLILSNPDVRISYVVADRPSVLYSNGIGDEVVYIESGRAVLESVFGRIEVESGDNVVIPRVAIHRWIPEDVETVGPLKAFVVEGAGHVRFPRRYLSEFGQFLEGAPLCERDIRGPQGSTMVTGEAADADTDVYVKHRTASGILGSVVTYDHHPFDVVGWDGCLYPYAFNYRDFSPVTGEILQPPTSYQILEGRNFVICNFVPRPLEYHPRALKVPYYHSNVDSDEVMFYHAGETAARKGSGIGNASVSLHPAAYTHGPGRQAYLDSPAMTESNEMAFMVDTFNPLELGEGALASDDPGYAGHWTRGRGVVREESA
ncbi:homogentisate 1,2-dioxygenase [Gordonia terrae]|uniref:Homogentisate 1,2-dioxygenase n=2 Tax=Gordonia terrae TaxID=2055 RepID=A0AAD0NWL0_9ACTN|nr:homogentisate 1,2-dioxygenase domain-containing protein [Gordonia terrae]VTR06838.1 homogentisate 1,2-dioxygenase [Clostridioides difficile]ANY22535.1 homogentisate 1,2-dioxygenase [Gordonia terrae]AWO83272.1 homogentisate 1,2-dioxygenase [Gordonia terrae]VTS36699.1 homogentisate 1,2-dioxygenase [Gordonia terrae]GAB43382.1 putative homogentisate 1,2-dioxygenase [Gordonia terrae NBRC 100016]